jgi:hypothetical protein
VHPQGGDCKEVQDDDRQIEGMDVHRK